MSNQDVYLQRAANTVVIPADAAAVVAARGIFRCAARTRSTAATAAATTKR
jgi:hypothetical protein